jgi:hypothetical protein
MCDQPAGSGKENFGLSWIAVETAARFPCRIGRSPRFLACRTPVMPRMKMEIWANFQHFPANPQ